MSDIVLAKRLLAATLIMDILLEGKTDRFGRPLSDHCLRVMEACRTQGLTEDQCIAAVLHEVYEESEFDGHAIRTLFGDKVGDLLIVLTRWGKVSYRVYIEVVSGTPDAIPIKLADLADNLDPSRVDLATGEGIPLSLRERYERAREYLQSVLDKAHEG